MKERNGTGLRTFSILDHGRFPVVLGDVTHQPLTLETRILGSQIQNIIPLLRHQGRLCLEKMLFFVFEVGV